jgi:magnesium transporter
MLYANTGATARHTLDHDHGALTIAEQAVWLDLVEADDSERSIAERASNLRVPARSELEEIESSSRLNFHNGVLTLSTPVVSRVADRHPILSPVGFVVSREKLLTVRFADVPVFDRFAEHFGHGEEGAPTSLNVFLGLLEAIVDRLADVLEQVGTRLEGISGEIFHRTEKGERESGRWDERLQSDLRDVGRTGQLLTKIHISLLGVGRVATYAATMMEGDLDHQAKARFRTLRRDISSLQDHQKQLADNVQFMLDATLGFINIQQNNVMKVLTIVSVVGIPPTLMAGVWGMNFKNMPELQWDWGYPFAWATLVITALLPLIWFKRKGWI